MLAYKAKIISIYHRLKATLAYIAKTLTIIIISLFVTLYFNNRLLAKELTNITLILDWTPNTNHTGIVVAQRLGFYKKEGLKVKVIQPGKGSAEQLLARNFANFAISSESNLVEAITKGMPLISIAAIIAHDTSGFYSLKDKNIKTPKDFEGKTYGSWGSALEVATIKAMMQKVGADFNKVKIITIGNADFFRAKNIDFVWGFEAWTGVIAKVNNIPVNYISIRKTINRDGYTPIIITNNDMLEKHKDLIHKFMRATTKGYEYAIYNPKQAANILLQAYPELDTKLVTASQEYLASKYKADSAFWGYQHPKVWQNYITWMFNNQLIKQKIDSQKLFTNEFLPKP